MGRVLLHPLSKDHMNIYISVVWSHLLLITIDSCNWKKPRSQGPGFGRVQQGCAFLAHPSLALDFQSHPPEGPWHGDNAQSVAWSWRQELVRIPQAAPSSVTGITAYTLSCHQAMLLQRRRHWKPKLFFVILQWKKMLKCQKCPWTKNHWSWLSVADKLDYEHRWGKCQFLHWCTSK